MAVNRIDKQCHVLHVGWRPDIYKMDDDLFPEEFYLECIGEKRLFVAKIHGTVVGVVLLRRYHFGGPGNVERDALMIDNFAVEESCRGQGIGTMMMQDVLALAKAFGCTDLQLSVQPQNDAALALYRKFGFTIRNINMHRKA